MAVPDIVELHILEAILKDASHPLHVPVMEAYLANLALWRAYHDSVAAALPQSVAPPAGVTYVLAAYATLDALAGPLAASFYGVHVSRLYGTGVPVPPGTFSIVPELQQMADLDGDGFTNLEESLYVAHRYQDTVENALDCSNPQGLQYSALDIYSLYMNNSAMVPVFDPEATDRRTPTCVRVTLNREGEGVLLPFEGSCYLSKYNLLDWYAWIADENNDPEHDNPGAACGAAQLYVEARPGQNWILDYWELRDGSLGEIMEASDITPDRLWRLMKPVLTVPLTGDTELTGLFDSRVEMADLDLISHLGNFLVYIGALENAGDVLECNWDLGGFTEEDGNNLPDTAEFYLLQHILESAGLDLTVNHGVHSGMVYSAWAHNMSEVRSDLPQQPLEVQRTVAAYMTLGYSGAILPIIEDKYGVILEEQGYDMEATWWLAANGDANFDGIENRQAWIAVVNNGGTGMTAIQAFAQQVLDPGASGGIQEKGINKADCTVFVNDDCNTLTACVRLYDAWMIPGPGVVLEVEGTTDDCNAQDLIKNNYNGTQVRYGHTVTVSVTNNLYPDLVEFKCWKATDTFIDGCPSPTASFVVSGPVSIYAIYEDVSQTSVFVPAENIPQGMGMRISGPKTALENVYGSNGAFIGRNVMSQTGKVVRVSFSSCDYGMSPRFRDEHGHIVNCTSDALLPSKDNLQSYWVGCGFRPYQGTRTATTRVIPNIAIAPVRKTYTYANSFARQTVLPLGYACNGSPFLSEWPYGFFYVGYESVSTPTSATFTYLMNNALMLSAYGCGQEGYVAPVENAKFYYHPGMGEGPGTEIVKITAVPLPGYGFKEWIGWGGDGVCYPNGNMSAPESINGCTSPTISIIMNKSRSVKPIFEEICFAKLALRVVIESKNGPCFVFPPWTHHGHAWIEVVHNSVKCGLQYKAYGFYDNQLEYHDANGLPTITASRYYEITLPQYKDLEKLIRWYQDEVFRPYFYPYSTLSHNCASFASKAIKEATGEDISPYLIGGPHIPMPSAMCQEIRHRESSEPTSEENPKKFCGSTNKEISLSGKSTEEEYRLVENTLPSENNISKLVPISIPKSTSCYSIQDAITQNDTTYIEGYLSAGGDIDATDSYGKTLLHYAIQTGQIDMIDFLLTKGANPYGFYYDPATGQGYEDTPLYAAYQLQNDCEFAPSLCTTIVTVIAGAAATVDTDSTSIANYMANDNVSGIMNVLASGTAIYRETMEQLSWYALENNDLTLFTATIQHPSFSLLFTAEDFFNELMENKTQYQGWINLMRNYSNRSFYVYVKYACTDWECAEDGFLDSLLILACAQGNLDLVNFLLPLGADPTVQVTEEETLLDYIGEDWSQLGLTFPMVLPDWPTDKDAEILQVLQAYVPSP
ncbi:MAG: hypothetical protein GXY07_14210 [Candidatus Hydrogenedentes bacterium]|nr:hypothetical protein [Candidatus Hydrogenedentota bacterium]